MTLRNVLSLPGSALLFVLVLPIHPAYDDNPDSFRDAESGMAALLVE